MGNLVGLPGVKGGTIKDVPFASSVFGAMTALTTSRAVTGAGDHGAWTVWKDDDGAYRCNFCRHRVVSEEKTFASKTLVRAWLRTWIPKVSGKEGGAA